MYNTSFCCCERKEESGKSKVYIVTQTDHVTRLEVGSVLCVHVSVAKCAYAGGYYAFSGHPFFLLQNVPLVEFVIPCIYSYDSYRRRVNSLPMCHLNLTLGRTRTNRSQASSAKCNTVP